MLYYLFFYQQTVYVTHPVLVPTSVVLLMNVVPVPVKDHVMGLLVSVRKTSASVTRTVVQ